jgi:HEAT repeat protein
LSDRVEKLCGELEKIALNPEYDESIRWSAVMILRNNNSFRDIEFFFRMLAQPDWMIRNEGVLALISRKDLFTWEEAASRLENFNKEGKYSIFWLIGMIGDEGSVSWLESRMNDPECGWMAAVGLGLTGSDRAMKALIEGLKNQDINLKRACLWALACLGTQDAGLFSPFLNHEDPELARLALTGMQRVGPSGTSGIPDGLE